MNRKDLLVKSAQLAPIGLLAACTRSIVPPFVPGSPGISDLLEPDKRYRPGQGFHAGKYYFDAQWYEPHEFPGMIYFAISNTELKRQVGQWYCDPLAFSCNLDMECKECCGLGGLMYDCGFAKSFTFHPGSKVWTKGHILNIFGNYFHVGDTGDPDHQIGGTLRRAGDGKTLVVTKALDESHANLHQYYPKDIEVTAKIPYMGKHKGKDGPDNCYVHGALQVAIGLATGIAGVITSEAGVGLLGVLAGGAEMIDGALTIKECK